MERFDKISTVVTSKPGKNFYEVAEQIIGIPNHERALSQHDALCENLIKCGVQVINLGAEENFPSKCFVNNVAVVTEYLAILSNFPEDHTRQGEQKQLASALAGERFLKFVTYPGFFDAGDVLRLSNNFYIRLSENTNHEGAAQLAFFLKEAGFNVDILDKVEDAGYPLSKGAAYLGNNRILIREDLAKNFTFLEYDKIVLPYSQRGATSSLMVNGTLLIPAGYSEVSEKVRSLGIPVLEVNISEFEKVDRGINCMLLGLIRREQHDNGIALSKQAIASIAA